MHEKELKVDYFENLSKCVDGLENGSKDSYSLRGYFNDILASREALGKLLENYISMKKACRWILFAMVWMLFWISPSIPGVPSFMGKLIQAIAEKVGEKWILAVMIAPHVLPILVIWFECVGVADDFSLLFWLVFPVVPIATGLCGAYGIIGGSELLGETDYVLIAWIMAGIHLLWLILVLLVVLYVRHQEGKKRKDAPALRREFVKAVDANAEVIHRYIRLRAMWWKNLYGSRALPYSLTHLQDLLDQYVKEAEKYRNMK